MIFKTIMPTPPKAYFVCGARASFSLLVTLSTLRTILANKARSPSCNTKYKMVATSHYSATAPSISGLCIVSAPPRRQSSLRSVSSTHSRRSLAKAETLEEPIKRVRFACTDELDLSENDNVGIIREEIFEFEAAPEECSSDLYFSQEDIMDFRRGCRKIAAEFAAEYPDYSESVDALYNGSDWVELKDALRNRRRRRAISDFAWLDSDIMDLEAEDDYDDNDSYCGDDVEDDNFYSTMRGLESRIASNFRMRRRWAIHSVLALQRDMKASSCKLSQIELGLRARSVQLTQKSRNYAIQQAALDQMEVLYR
jgi:hypothetical protein